ncbi:MAG: peptidylprolyl isomerase [Cyanobacteriota bacterium]|jgi:parvulin-like peptidyl-prolyl isomerase
MGDRLLSLTADTVALLRRHGLLRLLVEREVLSDLLGSEPLDPSVAGEARLRFCQQRGLDSEQALADHQASQGLRDEDLAWQMELPSRLKQHALAHFSHKAEARFLSRKTELDRVVYSLLRVRDGLLARELYFRISAGEASFADLAARFAEGPEKATNGIVGPVPLTQAHPVLAEKLRVATPGVLVEPFPLAEWWLVVRLERYTPAIFDEAMAQQMAVELLDAWVQQETTRRLETVCGSSPSALSA